MLTAMFCLIALICAGQQRPSVSTLPPGRAPSEHYFSEAFVYQYTVHGEEQFVWLMYNPETQEMLYVPDDDMMQAVIAFPNGNYIGYLTDGNGKKRTIRRQVPEVAGTETGPSPALHRLTAKPLLKRTMRREYQQNELITSSAIEVRYMKTGEQETVYVTEDLRVNTYQIYGFNRLEGNMRLPFALDYIGILTKRQLATAIEKNPYQTAKLNGHTATVYYFDTAGYD